MDRRDFLKKSMLLSSGLLGAGAILGSSKAQARCYTDLRRIDAYCHWSSLEIIRVLESAVKIPNFKHPYSMLFANNPSLIDVSARLKLMDKMHIDHNILVPLPWLESIPMNFLTAEVALDAAQTINDQMAKIVSTYPDKFSAVALLPVLRSKEDMLKEFERCVKDLGMVGGFYVCSYVAKPPDHPDLFDPDSDETLYGKAVELGVPLWLHPAKPPILGDYAGEDAPAGPGSMYNISGLAWLLDSSTAMMRMVFAGVFDKYPDLKIIIHHHGALIPLYAEKLVHGWEFFEKNTGVPMSKTIKKPYIDHFRNFYTDTATSGFSPHLITRAVDFFGADHVLFGTDGPMDEKGGEILIQTARDSVEDLCLHLPDMRKIFSENIKGLVKLQS